MLWNLWFGWRWKGINHLLNLLRIQKYRIIRRNKNLHSIYTIFTQSSFLQTILGELPIHSGKISIQGKLGYAAQDPWLFDGTVRQNILFGNEYDDQRYNDTIQLCNMEQDIASFQDGSNEMVGDRGTTLSGGQKARLNLARAIYRDSDVYLLDDPLSAVDANVGKDLFERQLH